MTKLLALFLLWSSLAFGQAIPFPGPGTVHSAASGANGFTHYRILTYGNSSKIPSSQTNFPVLFDSTVDAGLQADLKVTGSGGFVTSSSGFDIIIYPDTGCGTGGAKLDHEIEVYNSGTGEAKFWFRQPTLSASGTFVVCYGKPSITTSQQNVNSTWNSNYVCVWHLKEASGGAGAIKNSTSNSCDATDGGSPTFSATGQIGKGISFNGSSAFLSAPIDLSATNKVTASFWLNNSVAFDADNKLMMELTNNYNNFTTGFIINPSAGTPIFDLGVIGNAGDNDADFTQPSGTQMRYYAAMFDKSQAVNEIAAAYVDGASQTLTPGFTVDNGNNFANDTLYMMSRGGVSLFLAGTLDEVRISNSIRPADWVTAEYNNQFSPSTFYSVGAAQ